MQEWEIIAVIVGVALAFFCSFNGKEQDKLEEYGELHLRIEGRLKETRKEIEVVRQLLRLEDHTVDQAILLWKIEYLQKQEEWLKNLMCGEVGEEDV